jgi:hypothetical protein
VTELSGLLEVFFSTRADDVQAVVSKSSMPKATTKATDRKILFICYKSYSQISLLILQINAPNIEKHTYYYPDHPFSLSNAQMPGGW